MIGRHLLPVCLGVALLPGVSTAQSRWTLSDPLSAVQLVTEWASEMGEARRTGRQPARGGALNRALRGSLGQARADSVRSLLESLVYTSPERKVRTMAIMHMTDGYKAHAPAGYNIPTAQDSRRIAEQLRRIYHTSQLPDVKQAVLTAVGALGGSGRHDALVWLEPLITQAAEEQAFPWEASEAVRTASWLDAQGRQLVVRLRDSGLIRDPDALWRAYFIRVSGEP